MQTPKTITLTLTADEAWHLAQRCADACSYWHSLWQDAADGKRPDLHPDACYSISRSGWAFYEQIHALIDA
jgi:hypothetical protein